MPTYPVPNAGGNEAGGDKEAVMNIVYAAEKPSIAGILSEHLDCPVGAREIEVVDNPDETGSFLVRWRWQQFVLAPDGHLVSDSE